MSLVVDLTLDEGVIVIRCMSENVAISAINALPGGGSRVTCTTGDGAARIRRKLRRYLILDAQ